MKTKLSILAISALLALLPIASFAEDIKNGDTLQTLTNLHPDPTKRLIYTVNYQQDGLIPACSEITVKKISRKRMTFDYEGIEYRMDYDRNIKKAGISFQQVAQSMVGPKCDSAKIASLSATDKEGIEAGLPRVGMTRDGVYFAMGRPPFHVNPKLEVREWMYWRNRFSRRAVEFDDNGIVTNIR